MAQHPLTKLYVREFVKQGGKEWKHLFDMNGMEQRITFGYTTFFFQIQERRMVASYNDDLIPQGARYTPNAIVMIPDATNMFAKFLPQDDDFKKEYSRFMEVVEKTFAVIEE